MSHNCSVYILLDVNNPGIFTFGEFKFNYLPIYVGQGNKERPKKSSRSIYLKYGVSTIIEILCSNLSKPEAIEKEFQITDIIGRQIDGGPLFNKVRGNKSESDCQREHLIKMGINNVGKTSSPEHRAKIKASNTGKTHSPETKAKIGAKSKGRSPSPETRAKISASMLGEKNHFFNKKHTPESKAKIGKSSAERKRKGNVNE
jgi:hypothetical protein